MVILACNVTPKKAVAVKKKRPDESGPCEPIPRRMNGVMSP